jgi:hypothetical protein
MTETRPAANAAAPRADLPDPTGWVGWVLFAGVMLLLIAFFQAIAGFVALFNDEYYVTPARDLVIHMDYTAWGITHLVIALVCVYAAFGVFVGKTWARAFAITVAFLSCIGNIMFIGAYPVWGLITITIDVLVIFALAVHGRETRSLV